MQNVYLGIVLSPLAGSLVAGLFGKQIGRAGTHWITIFSIAISFLLSLVVLKDFVLDGAEPFNDTVYTWMSVDSIRLEIGFLIDSLTAIMITVVTFVSLMVHIYTVGYMQDDPGYQRFFCYIALFTFAMLMLVMSNNFLQLFFGWEAVGLASYLLIGFWYERPSASSASLKAFLINRVGDLGFLLGIAAILMYFNSLDYVDVFAAAPLMADVTVEIIPGVEWSVITVICILLFIGAMGKSAQVPLHVWLPDSMEGPTPISALIHAATMVTAGIFMVARTSPLFELSTEALSFLLVTGAITSLSMGLLAVVQYDIKRVVAYSTLSQLGYMVAALGASAYAAAVFHLMTHAFFKALLFLAAGSVIIALHHEQDIRKMGGLRKLMPITHITFLIGVLALVGMPGFSGFYSKDSIIEAIHETTIPGSLFAYWCLLAGVFITALYSFRLYFTVFHDARSKNSYSHEHVQESPWVVTGPLIVLAIPSVVIGYLTIEPLLFGEVFQQSIHVYHNVLHEIGKHFHGPLNFAWHGLFVPPFWLMAAGLGCAWYLYVKRPELENVLRRRFPTIISVLEDKYGFDDFYRVFLADGGRRLGQGLSKYGEMTLIDGALINGTANLVSWMGGMIRRVQTGYLYHYAFTMIVGLLALLTWFLID